MVMEVFSTITSSVFSELVIVIGGNSTTYLPSEIPLWETLRTMNQIRPFKLVFLLAVLDLFQEEARRKLEGPLDSMAARGLLKFLDSPPIIRTT